MYYFRSGAAGHESDDTMQRSGDWEHLQANNDGKLHSLRKLAHAIYRDFLSFKN